MGGAACMHEENIEDRPGAFRPRRGTGCDNFNVIVGFNSKMPGAFHQSTKRKNWGGVSLLGLRTQKAGGRCGRSGGTKRRELGTKGGSKKSNSYTGKKVLKKKKIVEGTEGGQQGTSSENRKRRY